MRRSVSVPAAVLGTLGVALLAVGIVYLSVACENLPGFLGPTAGDTSPRTRLGIIGVALGALVLAGTLLLARLAHRRADS